MGSESAFWVGLSAGALEATENAAIACANFRGMGDKIGADQAAVEAMRDALNSINFDGHVVIGEGELDDAPMLFLGERLGTGKSVAVDVAVDPLEGTTLCASNLPGAVTTIAMAPRGTLFTAPDSYMLKIMVGPNCSKGLIDLDLSITENVNRYAEDMKKSVRDITVCVLDKPRHAQIIAEIEKVGAKIRRIPDGDVPAALWVCDPSTYGVDIYYGTGGAPEGVLSAAALKCLGGDMQGRISPMSEGESKRVSDWITGDPNRKLCLSDLVAGDAIFSMTSVTGSDGLDAVSVTEKMFVVQSFSTSSFAKTIKKTTTRKFVSL
jgi:fructose-1,6-bisphosphatase II / sedoheptulose-1,7-bisphosphatase